MTETITVARLAEVSGLSIPTVSKVINHRKGVSRTSREAVERAIEQTGYVKRSRGARGGISIVDLLISGLDSQWAFALIQGASDEAQRLGLEIIVTANMGQVEAQEAWLQRVASRGTAGVISVVSQMTPETVDELRRQEVPVVLVDPIGSGEPNFSVISATNWAGGLSATEHLIGLGHRRIGIITGPVEEACTADRLDGYSAALRRAGISLDDDLIRHGDSLVDGGKLNGGILLDLPNPPTAIFSCSDEQAYGVYEAAAERRIKIPKHLSVVGFDDVNLCQWVSPQLTTVRQPLSEMGAVAVRRVANTADGAGRLELPTSLIVRESTAPARR